MNDLRELEDIDLTALFRLTPESCGKTTAIIHLSDIGLDPYPTSLVSRAGHRLPVSGGPLEMEYDICLIDPQLGWENIYYLVFDTTGGSGRSFADNMSLFADYTGATSPFEIGYVVAFTDDGGSFFIDWGTRADGAYFLYLPFAKQIEVELVLSERPIAEAVTHWLCQISNKFFQQADWTGMASFTASCLIFSMTSTIGA